MISVIVWYCIVQTQTRSGGLAHLAVQVPGILNSLPRLDLKALLSTSSILRSCVHQHVTKINLGSLGVDEQSVQLLTSGNWPSLQVLNLRCNDLSSAGMAGLQLGTWSCLRTLNLEQCNLSSSSIKALTEASWNTLEELSLGVNPLATCDIMQLSKGEWQNLKKLLLHGVVNDTGLQPAEVFTYYIVQACKSRWQHLFQLNIAACGGDTVMSMGATLPVDWLRVGMSQLQDLDLSHQQLDTDSFSSLSQADLPSLNRLALAATGMSAGGMKRLMKANWPVLHSLNISQNPLHTTAISKLVMAQWPELKRLCLRNTQLNKKGIAELVKGNWPRLNFLDVSTCGLNAEAVRQLLNGQWPLHFLELPCVEAYFEHVLEVIISNPAARVGIGMHKYAVPNPQAVLRGQFAEIKWLAFSNPTEAPIHFNAWDGPDGWPCTFA